MLYFKIYNNTINSRAMGVHTFNPSTWKAEAGRTLCVRGKHSLQGQVHGYIDPQLYVYELF